jgi:hypothetical protein
MDIFYDIMNFGSSDTWIVIVAACLLSFFPFATLGFLFSKHRKEDPSYIIGLDKVKNLKGAWTLLLLLIAPLVFIYNVFVWSGYAFVVIAHFAAYLIKTIYDLIVEYIVIPFIEYIVKPFWEFIKTIFPIWKIIRWIVSALIWLFWNIFWMPIKIVLMSLYHYCIVWVWDLYKTSFSSIKGTYKKSRLRVTFEGAFYALSIIGLAIYLSILTGYVVFGMIGLLLASLPSIRAYGTVTSMSHSDDRDHSQHGSKVMKTALNYVIASVVAVVAIELLLLFSWIPDLGLVFLGVAINTNVFLSAILILSLIVLFFAQSIFPNHLLYHDESTSMQDSVMNYLASIRDKGLQLLVSLVPGSLWTLVVLIIPAALITISVSTSDSFKNNTLSERGKNIAENINEADSQVSELTANFTADNLSDIEDAFEEAIAINVRSNQNTFGLDFPQNVIEQPEIIFSDNATAYSSSLPRMLKGAINDTLVIRNRINNSKSLIKRITKHIAQYKSQQWSFTVKRKERSEPDTKLKVISQGTDIASVLDVNVQEGKSYVYRVQALNKNGNSAWSADYGRGTLNSSLAAPSGFRIKSESNFRIIFSWNDNSDIEDGFVIERRLSNTNDKWSEYATIGPDLSQYIVSNVESMHRKKYDYRMFAQASNEKSSSTSIVSHQLRLSPPSRLEADANLRSVKLDWAYNFGYSLERWNWVRNKRNKGAVTANKSDGALPFGEKSLADLMQEKIDKEKKKLAELNKSLEFAIEKISMFEGLVDYDKSQRTMLKVFKNFAFLFAILFTALFGGMILAVAMSYIASLFYHIFTIRGNDPWYFMSLIRAEKEKNKNQPLLAFTVWILAIIFFTSGSFLVALIA